jgi:ankyrin repeat protein
MLRSMAADADQVLLQAIDSGSDEEVAAALRAGASPVAERKPYTALHIAVCRKRVEIARMLLEAGAPVDTTNYYYRRTPLHYAVEVEGETCAKLFVERGADVRARDANGGTPLSFAARANNVAAIRLLASRGAEVDTPNDSGRTPISIAAAELARESVEVLLSLGADPRLANESGWTPLHAVIAALADHGMDGLDDGVSIIEQLRSRGADPSAATTETLLLGEEELPRGSTPADVAAKLPLKRLRDKATKALVA